MPPKSAQLKAANTIRAIVAQHLHESDSNERHEAVVKIAELLRAEMHCDAACPNDAETDDILNEAGTLFVSVRDKQEMENCIQTLCKGLAPDARERSIRRASVQQETRAASPQPQEQPTEREHRNDAVAQVAELTKQMAQLEQMVKESVSPQKQRKRRPPEKCPVCKCNKARCCCPPIDKTDEAIRKTKKSTEESHEEQSSTDEEVSDDVEESEESEETDEDEEEKSEHKSKRTSIDLDDPGVLLDPKQWGAATRANGELAVREAMRGFYEDETRKRKHEVHALTDIVAKLAKSLSKTSLDDAKKEVEKAGQRVIARLEYLAGFSRVGPKGAAAIEDSLLNQNLPKAVKKGRIQGRIEQKRYRGRGRGDQERGRGFKARGSATQANAPHPLNS